MIPSVDSHRYHSFIETPFIFSLLVQHDILALYFWSYTGCTWNVSLYLNILSLDPDRES
jgi:hypothetical protein